MRRGWVFILAAVLAISSSVPNGHDRSEQLALISAPEGGSTSPAPRKRAIVVARVSTTAQAEADKASRKVQVETCKGAAEALGYTVVKVIEIAVSGANAEAAHLAVITRMAERKEAEAVFFYNGDRSFRDTELGLSQMRRWKALGLKIFWGTREVDIDDPDGKMMASVELSFSSHKRDKLRQASNFRQHYARTEGRWYGRAPLGYTLTEKRQLMVDTELAAVIVELFRNVADHMAFNAVLMAPARKLGLTLDALNALIANPVYKGIVRLGKNEFSYEVDGTRPYRIVDDDLWGRAQNGLRRTRGWHDKQKLVEQLARDIGELELIDTIVRAFRVLCQCGNPVHYNGVKRVRGRDIPQVICKGGHARGLAVANDLDELTNPNVSCFDCRASRKSDFAVVPIRRGFRATCKRCGWTTRTRRHPFAKPVDRPLGGRDRRLDEF